MTGDEKPVLLAAFGDTHCGSTEGLMRPRQYQFHDMNISPNPRQRSIWRRFEQYADKIASLRTDKRLIVVLNGDLIDGDHHNTHQLVTRKSSEQERIFEDVWDYFTQAVGFGGDDLAYVMRGTDLNGSHGAMDSTDNIGRNIGAVPAEKPKQRWLDEFEDGRGRVKRRAVDGWYAWQNLSLNILGHLCMFTHHAPAGLGRRQHTKGNGVRSWLRSFQTERKLRGLVVPRYVVWAHVHTAHREWMALDNGTPEGIETTAVILPALQGATDYVHQRIPLAQPTTIGGWWAEFRPGMPPVDKLEYVELNLEQKPERI